MPEVTRHHATMRCEPEVASSGSAVNRRVVGSSPTRGAVSAASVGSRSVPDLRPRFDELLRRLGEISDVERAEFMLTWDQETKMPPLGAAVRAEQLSTLARIAHDLSTSPELGSLLDDLREFENGFERESFEASVIRVARRDYEKKKRVPSELRAQMTRAASLGYTAWLDARETGDFESFRPHLERRLALTNEYVACFEPFDDPYDVLL